MLEHLGPQPCRLPVLNRLGLQAFLVRLFCFAERSKVCRFEAVAVVIVCLALVLTMLLRARTDKMLDAIVGTLHINPAPPTLMLTAINLAKVSAPCQQFTHDRADSW